MDGKYDGEGVATGEKDGDRDGTDVSGINEGEALR